MTAKKSCSGPVAELLEQPAFPNDIPLPYIHRAMKDIAISLTRYFLEMFDHMDNV